MNEAQQAERINAWRAEAGKIANMRERLASVSEPLVGRCTRSAQCRAVDAQPFPIGFSGALVFKVNEAIVRSR